MTIRQSTPPEPERCFAVPVALAVRELSITYPARRRQCAIDALQRLNLTIESGQTVAMLGPNGSGKSTLIAAICGLLQPRPGRGEIEIFGNSSPRSRREAIGVVFQRTALDAHQTVEEALRDQAALYGLRGPAATDRIDAELDRADLKERRGQLIRTLSLGLARRVDLIRAMLHRPKLLLMDEPTVGLDPAARQSFLRLIDERQAEQNLTVLISTHLTDEAERQDRVILIHQGKLVADDTPPALRRRLGNLVITVHDAQWQPQEAEKNHWHSREGAWTRVIDAERDQLADMVGELARQSVPFTVAPPTLGDVFEHLTGSALNADQRPSRQEVVA